MAAPTYIAPAPTASGTTFAQLRAGGLNTLVEAVLAASVPTAAPTAAPTVSANAGGASGGAMLPGNYFAKVTERDGFGETTASPASSVFAVARQAEPTAAATAAPTGGGATGGLLAAGTYLVAYTWVDALGGETTIGTSESAPVVVGATNIPRVTIPAKPAWASGSNIYLTAAGGLTGTEVLYAAGVTTATKDLATAAVGTTLVPAANTTTTNIPRVTFPALKAGNVGRNLYVTPAGGGAGTVVLYASGVTAATYDLAAAVDATSAAPPAAVTTGATAAQMQASRALAAELAFLGGFLAGSPVATAEVRQTVSDFAAEAHLRAQVLDELAAIVWANPGTIGSRPRGAGMDRETYRSFP